MTWPVDEYRVNVLHFNLYQINIAEFSEDYLNCVIFQVLILSILLNIAFLLFSKQQVVDKKQKDWLHILCLWGSTHAQIGFNEDIMVYIM